MKTTMLEYMKIVLQKVSFDTRLFEKELRKALRSLLPHEVSNLRDWCYASFGNAHAAVLNKYFPSVSF